MNNQLTWQAAVKETLPTIFGYIGIGLAFGVIGRTSGLAVWIVVLMSAFVYAGPAQFTTVSMLTALNPVSSIVLTTFLVNSRMILMSTTLSAFFKKDSMSKNLQIGSLLTDESFALSMNKLNYTQNRLSFEWLNTSNWIAYLTWVLSTLVGALLGNIISSPRKFGLDFALLAMFIGLLYLQVLADKSMSKKLQLLVILMTMLLTYVFMIILPASLVIVVTALVGCALGVLVKHAFF
ncbi:MAG: AzlC family ABC transporter permease [Oenococcus sp.]|uniref:AzlC family ABC transporter permease n=1 Tax=Oenococcus sp. TaxID=1979414 RepID=UPI0039ECD461